MIILALLVVALILLIVGVIESSAAWLLISTAISVLAGFLLYRSSRALSPRTGIPAGETVGATAAPSSGGEFDSAVRNSNQLPDGNHLAAPGAATRPPAPPGKGSPRPPGIPTVMTRTTSG